MESSCKRSFSEQILWVSCIYAPHEYRIRLKVAIIISYDACSGRDPSACYEEHPLIIRFSNIQSCFSRTVSGKDFSSRHLEQKKEIPSNFKYFPILSRYPIPLGAAAHPLPDTVLDFFIRLSKKRRFVVSSLSNSLLATPKARKSSA